MDKKVDTDSTPLQCTAKLQPITDALYVINGKWKLIIIIALLEGNNRFNELQRAIKGISAKALSNDLKELELNGFIERRVLSETPFVVVYEPTEYVHSLTAVLHTLAEWGSKHRDKIRSEK